MKEYIKQNKRLIAITLLATFFSMCIILYFTNNLPSNSIKEIISHSFRITIRIFFIMIVLLYIKKISQHLITKRTSYYSIIKSKQRVRTLTLTQNHESRKRSIFANADIFSAKTGGKAIGKTHCRNYGFGNGGFLTYGIKQRKNQYHAFNQGSPGY